MDLFPICKRGNQVYFFFCNEFSVNPSQPNYSSIFSILFSVHFLWRWQGEFVEQSKLLWLVIFPFILMILMNDSAVLVYGEISSWSLLGFKGLKVGCCFVNLSMTRAVRNKNSRKLKVIPLLNLSKRKLKIFDHVKFIS